MQILGLLGMHFDAAVVFVTNSSLLFRLALAILCRVSGQMFWQKWKQKSLWKLLTCTRPGKFLGHDVICFEYSDWKYAISFKFYAPVVRLKYANRCNQQICMCSCTLQSNYKTVLLKIKSIFYFLFFSLFKILTEWVLNLVFNK